MEGTCSWPPPQRHRVSRSRRALLCRPPRMRPRALPWASPLGLVAGLQQAGAVPLRRGLMSRVLPDSRLWSSGGSASLQQRREQPGLRWG